MSQFFTNFSGSNLPANIPTQFTEDSGTAVPAANNLNIFGADGIKTTGSGSTVTVGFNQGTNTTLGIATSTILTLTPPDNDTTTFQILISGYDATSNLGVGGQIIGTIRKTAGVVTVLGTPDIIKNGDFPLNGSTYTIVASGGDVLVQATSNSLDTVTWTALTAGQV